MPQSDLDRKVSLKHDNETAVIEEKRVDFEKVTCDLCLMHHATKDHNSIQERCKQENFEAARRLILKYSEDVKQRKALVEGGWINEKNM